MDDGTITGVNQNEYKESVDNLYLLANKLNCLIIKINESKTNQDSDNMYGEYLIRENNNDNYIDLKLAIIGNVDCGKSTITSVLTKGILDDGRGKARVHVFNQSSMNK
jgi:GTPase